MRLCEIDEGAYCRTVSGAYYFHAGGLRFCNELSKNQFVYPKDYDEEVAEILPGWPGLSQGEGFRLINEPRGFPHDVLIFKTDRDFRFRIRLNDYRIAIPFYFESSDKRVGRAESEWIGRSGRILNAIKNQELYIGFNELTPTLYVGMGLMSIPSQ